MHQRTKLHHEKLEAGLEGGWGNERGHGKNMLNAYVVLSHSCYNSGVSMR